VMLKAVKQAGKVMIARQLHTLLMRKKWQQMNMSLYYKMKLSTVGFSDLSKRWASRRTNKLPKISSRKWRNISSLTNIDLKLPILNYFDF
jgi:hypothetical protein